MKALKTSCPFCNLSIQVDRNQSHVGIKCQNCGGLLIPDNIRQAEKLEWMAAAFVVLSVILLLIGLAVNYWLIGISLWLFLTAQIVYIRALLTRK
jgi:uncharacterized paraquat-inducible protein A